MNATSTLSNAFTERALKIYEDAKSQIGYVAHRFRRKVLRDGGVAAAKRWLRPAKATPGFERLLAHHRLDLSVEAVAIQAPWNKLFTSAELETARDRLKQHGYIVSNPGFSNRSYWVVSPNVRNNEATVGAWRQASVSQASAFMGYGPKDMEHSQIGAKFAGNVMPGIMDGDVILIARRHQFEPEIVGFGIVRGHFATRLKNFKPPETFGSLRKLVPFIPWSGDPPESVPIREVIRHTKALVQLHPERNFDHRKICDWIDQQIQRISKVNDRKRRRPTTATQQYSALRIVASPKNHQLDYKVQTKESVIRAKKTEALLLEAYREWLAKQDRLLSVLKFNLLQCDAFEKCRANLLEAKSSASREHIRMAVGQLLDYAYQGRNKFGELHLAILLPAEPGPDMLEWLDSLGIKVVWRDKSKFLDNANGQFT